MIKTVALLLAFSLLIPMTISCASEKASQTDTSVDTSAISETPEEESEKTIYDIMGERDFGGRTFTLYNPYNWELVVDKGFWADGLTGESFNDAIYNRNLEVTEKYNFALEEFKGAAWNSAYGDLKLNISAGEKPYNIVLTHIHGGNVAMLTEGLLRTWDDTQYIDFTKPWWNQSIIKNLNVANRTYFTAGSLTIQSPLVLIFNKTMLTENNLEDPYELVRSGKWTVDKLGELASAAVLDKDGNGKWNPNIDQFGFSCPANWRVASFVTATADVSVKIDENGHPYLNLNGEAQMAAFEKLYQLFYDGNKTTTNSGVTLKTGRVLFEQSSLFDCELLKDVDIDYGILPLPKYDENQENYRTHTWTGMYALPLTLDGDELDFSCFVLEVMSALAYEKIVPVYYEQVLKSRISNDPDSAEMLDIILSNIVYDFGLCFELTGTSMPGYFISELINAKKKDQYASEYAKKADLMQKELDRIYELVLDLDT